jgi:hypothetical protein
MATRTDPKTFTTTAEIAPHRPVATEAGASETALSRSRSRGRLPVLVGGEPPQLLGRRDLDDWVDEEPPAIQVERPRTELRLPPASIPEHDWRHLPAGPHEHEHVVRGSHNRPRSEIVSRSLALGGGDLWEGLGLPGARRSDYRRCRSVQEIPAGDHDGTIDGFRVDELMGENADGDPKEEFLRGGAWHVDSGPTGNAPGRPEATTKSADEIERMLLLALQAAYEVVGPDREKVLQLAGVALFFVEPPLDLQAVADRLRPIRRGYGKSTLYAVRKQLRARFGKNSPKGEGNTRETEAEEAIPA